MGDYTYTTKQCPKCGTTIEVVDQPSSMLHSCKCENCGWTDGLEWVGRPDGVLELMPTDYKNYSNGWDDCEKQYETLIYELAEMIDSGSIKVGALGLSENSAKFVLDEFNKLNK